MSNQRQNKQKRFHKTPSAIMSSVRSVSASNCVHKPYFVTRLPILIPSGLARDPLEVRTHTVTKERQNARDQRARRSVAMQQKPERRIERSRSLSSARAISRLAPLQYPPACQKTGNVNLGEIDPRLLNYLGGNSDRTKYFPFTPRPSESLLAVPLSAGRLMVSNWP